MKRGSRHRRPQGRGGGWHVAPEEAPTPPPVEDAQTQAKLGEAGERPCGGARSSRGTERRLVTEAPETGWLQGPAGPTEQLQVPLLGAEGGAKLGSIEKAGFGAQHSEMLGKRRVWGWGARIPGGV